MKVMFLCRMFSYSHIWQCYYCCVQATETASSSAMELEGLKRCRKFLEDNDVPVTQLTTDRHASVKAYMKNSWKSVKHYFDTWHFTKGKPNFILLYVHRKGLVVVVTV